MSNAVWPSLVFKELFTDEFKSKLTIFKSPLLAATCKAVNASSHAAFPSAP
jgi:hypothetical protein